MIAVFADQHVREQRRRCQATGYHPFRRGRLHHLVAGPTGVFRTSGADDTKLSRHPVQHLADALADQVKSAAAAAANLTFDIEPNVFTRQMIRQSSASRLASSELRRRPSGWLFLDAGNVAVDIFQAERELVGIDALGAAPELHSLQLFDDRFEALDLTVAVVDGSGNVAHQTLQKLRIGREIVEIELHVRLYSNTLIRRRITAQFTQLVFADSACRLQASRRVLARASRCLRSASQAAPVSA